MDSNQRIPVLQTGPLDHLGTAPSQVHLTVTYLLVLIRISVLYVRFAFDLITQSWGELAWCT